jgi:hypothetical protein
VYTRNIKVKTYFAELPNSVDRIVRSDVKRFVTVSANATNSQVNKTRLFESGKCNTLLARAATVQGNKGISSDIFILEEAARIPQQVACL